MNLGIKNLKKTKKKKLIESQKWALEKFVTSNKQNITEKLADSSKNEQEIHFKELEDNTIIPSKDTNENNPCDSQLIIKVWSIILHLKEQEKWNSSKKIIDINLI